MPRKRTIPDDRIFQAIQKLLDEGGDRAVSFATVAAATGLAPPTLVQRYGSRDGMVRAARVAAWDRLSAATARAISATEDKGPQALLKALAATDPASLVLDARDQKARESAAMLFAAWQGQLLWASLSPPGFKLKDAVRRLT